MYRRDFMKLIGSLPFALSACYSGVLKPSEFDNAPILEFEELHKTVSDLISKFGDGIIFGSEKIILEPYNAYKQVLNGEAIEGTEFNPADWGQDMVNLAFVVDNHFRNVVMPNVTTIPDPNYPELIPEGYEPPDINQVEESLYRFMLTFPYLSMVVNKVNINNYGYGGSSRHDWINIPDFKNSRENSCLTTIHESVHCLHSNYLALKRLITLQEFSKIPETLVKSIEKIMMGYCSVNWEKDFDVKYGISFYKFYSTDSLEQQKTQSETLNFLNECLSILELDDEMPDEIKIHGGENEKDRLVLLNHEYNWLIHKVSSSIHTDKNKFDSTSAKVEKKNHIITILFSEIQHYLVGPYQQDGKIVSKYPQKERTGVWELNLEHHKKMMDILVNPVITSRPVSIRESLGLFETDSITDFGPEVIGTEIRNEIEYRVYKTRPYNGAISYLVRNIGYPNNNLPFGKCLNVPLTRGEKLDKTQVTDISLSDEEYPLGGKIYTLNEPVIFDNKSLAGRIGTADLDFISEVPTLPVMNRIFFWLKLDDSKPEKYFVKNSDQLPDKMMKFDEIDRHGNTNTLLMFSEFEKSVAVTEFLPNLRRQNVTFIVSESDGQSKILMTDPTGNNGSFRVDFLFPGEVVNAIKLNPNLKGCLFFFSGEIDPVRNADIYVDLFDASTNQLVVQAARVQYPTIVSLGPESF